MTRAIYATLAAVVMACCSVSAYAADELAVYVFKDGNAGAGLTAILDGQVEKTIGEDGSTRFDLGPGAHIIGILDGEELVYSIKFDSVVGQYADATINLAFGQAPRGNVQTYFGNESPADRARAPTGGLLGRVSDGSTDEPVMDARIYVEGTNYETKTDPFGNYVFTLPRGIYDIRIEAAGYGTQTIENVRVISDIQTGASFKINRPSAIDRSELSIAAPSIEEVFVVAKYKPTALGEDERYSSGVVDTLGIGELQRFGGSDITQSVIRVPSVTVRDGRFVFIRGLGGRYITTTLNGALLPSTDPTKRTVPLDLFPTNFVSQIDVKEVFPGEHSRREYRR